MRAMGMQNRGMHQKGEACSGRALNTAITQSTQLHLPWKQLLLLTPIANPLPPTEHLSMQTVVPPHLLWAQAWLLVLRKPVGQAQV